MANKKKQHLREGGQREPFIAWMPGTLAAGRTLDMPMMAIDLLPTIAELTGAPLPQKTIDGHSFWPVWTGASDEPPQDTYFCYYHVNELHSVRYKEWKLYFPHTYRTMGGRPGGQDGQPGRYEQDTIRQIELYNLARDIGETTDVADQYPTVVDTIQQLADDMRQRLGDRLYGIEGTENREPGRSGK